MIKAFLVDEDFIKENTSVSDNLDSKMLKPALYDAQEIYLQPLLGTKLYKKLQELVCDNTISDAENAKYKELLVEYVQPFLLKKTQEQLVSVLFFKARNAGNVQYYDNSQGNVGLKDMQWIKQDFANDATFLANRMSDWICANCKYIPEYYKADVEDMRSGTDNQNYCNINLSGVTGRRDTSIRFLRSTRFHKRYQKH